VVVSRPLTKTSPLTTGVSSLLRAVKPLYMR
jgi:hypothetical protein